MKYSRRRIINIIYLVTIFSSGISNADIIYNTDTKYPNQFSSELFNIKCPSSKKDAKSEYLCALKMMKNSQKEKEVSKKTLLNLASENIADAKYSLFISRKTLEISEKNAISYLFESANQGFVPSQLMLGEMYLNGDIIEKNEEKAFKWTKLAAEQNSYDGILGISRYYFSGTGTKRNDSLGFYWLSKLHDNFGPLFSDWDILGAAYETGRGTPVDLVKAYMCYDLEGTAGTEEKARIAPQMTAEQRAEGLRLSHEWQEKNHVYTMQSLGLSRQKDGSYR